VIYTKFVREVNWVEHVIQRAEAALISTTDPIERRRLTIWKLRIQGYTLVNIAEQLGISYGTAHADMQWCYKNAPMAYESAEEFRHIGIAQLEQQYQMLVTPRVILDTTETGDIVERVEAPSLMALKVAQSAKDMQAKLLGAYAPTRVEAGATPRRLQPALLDKIEAAKVEVERRAAELQAQAADRAAVGGVSAPTASTGSFQQTTSEVSVEEV
jgi:hypothetical protein